MQSHPQKPVLPRTGRDIARGLSNGRADGWSRIHSLALVATGKVLFLKSPTRQNAVLPTTAGNWSGCSCERQRADLESAVHSLALVATEKVLFLKRFEDILSTDCLGIGIRVSSQGMIQTLPTSVGAVSAAAADEAAGALRIGVANDQKVQARHSHSSGP